MHLAITLHSAAMDTHEPFKRAAPMLKAQVEKGPSGRVIA